MAPAEHQSPLKTLRTHLDRRLNVAFAFGAWTGGSQDLRPWLLNAAVEGGKNSASLTRLLWLASYTAARSSK
jgi:hypothetical protein